MCSAVTQECTLLSVRYVHACALQYTQVHPSICLFGLVLLHNANGPAGKPVSGGEETVSCKMSQRENSVAVKIPESRMFVLLLVHPVILALLDLGTHSPAVGTLQHTHQVAALSEWWPRVGSCVGILQHPLGRQSCFGGCSGAVRAQGTHFCSVCACSASCLHGIVLVVFRFCLL